MKKYTYCFTVLDEGGNMVAERDLTPEQAIDILVGCSDRIVMIGEAPIVPIAPMVPEEPVKKNKGGRPKKEKPAASKKTITHECCGSTGTRHFKWCTKKDQPKPEPEPKPRALSQEEYIELRTAMLDKEFMSGRYALAHNLSPKEVNAAVRSVSYMDYIESSA